MQHTLASIFTLGTLGLALIFSNGCGKKSTPDEADPGRVVSAEMLIFDGVSGEVIKAGESVPFTGKVVWFHPNGQREQETSYINGREEGQEVWWHLDGARAGQSHYKAGVLNGSTVQWHPGGTKMEFQVLYLNGMLDGKEVWWHDNGREQSVTHFENGLRQGRATGWYADGSKAWEALWVDDEPDGTYTEWYESGMMKNKKSFAQTSTSHSRKNWSRRSSTVSTIISRASHPRTHRMETARGSFAPSCMGRATTSISPFPTS